MASVSVTLYTEGCNSQKLPNALTLETGKRNCKRQISLAVTRKKVVYEHQIIDWYIWRHPIIWNKRERGRGYLVKWTERKIKAC